jgi:decaprenylphospho-beta-D-erythro-pentofuranosid-2-ulose 2-reductase
MPNLLILGATSDMATAIASKFASKGYSIQLAARNVTRLKTLQSDLNIRFNALCTLHEFDAVDFESHQLFFDALTSKPDITICVFGWMGDNEVVRTNWIETKQTIDSNFTGAVSILNVVTTYYAQQKKGIIVGISSVAGERGRQSNYIYGSAKAGFTAYLSGLRNRLYRENVHVVTVKPGFVFTKMTENLKLPKPLTATPGEVADSVFAAVVKKKNTIYVKWFWRWIMLLIRNIPEFLFKKLKL